MDRLISLQAAIDIVHWYYRHMYGDDAERSICESLERLPSAESKRGKWEEKYVAEDTCAWTRRRYYCSACGDWNTYGQSKFCPNCGSYNGGEA